MYGRLLDRRDFRDPDNIGGCCPWLADRMTTLIRAFENGGMLPRKYRGTSYEKGIDPNGITTQLVRCPDSTTFGIVIKLLKTTLPGR
jgi:hypothetical protein